MSETNKPKNTSNEVVAKATRRRFTAAYKRRIVEEADSLRGTGKVGEFLRREGLYSSQLAKWREQYRSDGEAGLAAQKRGRKPTPNGALLKKQAWLERENARLQKKLEQAEAIIVIQKKVAQLLNAEEHNDGQSS